MSRTNQIPAAYGSWLVVLHDWKPSNCCPGARRKMKRQAQRVPAAAGFVACRHANLNARPLVPAGNGSLPPNLRARKPRAHVTMIAMTGVSSDIRYRAERSTSRSSDVARLGQGQQCCGRQQRRPWRYAPLGRETARARGRGIASPTR